MRVWDLRTGTPRGRPLRIPRLSGSPAQSSPSRSHTWSQRWRSGGGWHPGGGQQRAALTHAGVGPADRRPRGSRLAADHRARGDGGRGGGRHPGGGHAAAGMAWCGCGTCGPGRPAGNRCAATAARSPRSRSGRSTAPRWRSPGAGTARCGCGTYGPQRPAWYRLCRNPAEADQARSRWGGRRHPSGGQRRQDGRVRVWDLRTGGAAGNRLAGPRLGLAGARGGRREVDGTPVAVSWQPADDTVRVWDLRSGGPRGETVPGHGLDHRARGRESGRHPSRGHRAALDGTVRVWDLRTGTARGEPLPGSEGFGLLAVAVGEVDGTPVAVSGGLDGTVRVWDLRTGTARGAPLRGHTGVVRAGRRGGRHPGGGQRRPRWHGAAVGSEDRHGPRGPAARPQRRGRRSRSRGGRWRPVLVSGDNNGTILWWALEQGQSALARLYAPAGIEAVVCCGQAGWMAATKDGSLFLWRPTPASWRALQKTTAKDSLS